jgi:intraflagellar transport protein 88
MFQTTFNLALQYEESEMYHEALAHYQALSGQKFLPYNGPKIRLNMGNVYMKLKQPNKAIKVYRMALDQLGNTNTPLRFFKIQLPMY